MNRLRVLWRAAVAVLASIGLLMVIVTFTPVVSWWAGKLGNPWNDPGGDTLIVLAGSNLPDRIIGLSSYWRAVYAVRAWREHHYPRIVLSGAPGAEDMRALLVAAGVPADILVLEPRSASTRENALNVKELLAGTPGSKVLLTSDYHMFRALHAFRKAGLEVAPLTFPDVRKRAAVLTGRWSGFLELAGETGKIAYYYAKGWI